VRIFSLPQRHKGHKELFYQSKIVAGAAGHLCIKVREIGLTDFIESSFGAG